MRPFDVDIDFNIVGTVTETSSRRVDDVKVRRSQFWQAEFGGERVSILLDSRRTAPVDDGNSLSRAGEALVVQTSQTVGSLDDRRSIGTTGATQALNIQVIATVSPDGVGAGIVI